MAVPILYVKSSADKEINTKYVLTKSFEMTLLYI